MFFLMKFIVIGTVFTTFVISVFGGMSEFSFIRGFFSCFPCFEFRVLLDFCSVFIKNVIIDLTIIVYDNIIVPPPIDSTTSFSTLDAKDGSRHGVPPLHENPPSAVGYNLIKPDTIPWINKWINPIFSFREQIYIDIMYWTKFIDDHEKKVDFEVWKAKSRVPKACSAVIETLSRQQEELRKLNPPKGLFLSLFFLYKHSFSCLFFIYIFQIRPSNSKYLYLNKRWQRQYR